MKRPNKSSTDKSFMPALCVSMMLHGLGLSALAWWVVKTTPPAKEPAWTHVAVLLASPAPKPKLAESPPPPKPAAPKKAAKKEPVKLEKPPTPMHDDSGENKGVGTANRSTDGQQAMKANQGYEQADLMKDAVEFIQAAFLPASKGGLKDNDADKQKSPPTGTVLTDATAQAKPQSVVPVGQAQKPDEKSPAPGPAVGQIAKADAVQSSGTKQPIPNAPAAAQPTPKPLDRQILGHKATLSDTESLAFAREHSATFQAGKLEGRDGVHVKTTEPRYGESANIAFGAVGSTPTVLSANIDSDGKILNVDVLETCGSEFIDQDRKLCVYRWTLPPKKDPQGRPVLIWVINFG